MYGGLSSLQWSLREQQHDHMCQWLERQREGGREIERGREGGREGERGREGGRKKERGNGGLLLDHCEQTKVSSGDAI